jgi:hypothetical protein
MKNLQVFGAFLALLSLSLSLPAIPLPEPSAEALEVVKTLRASSMGVDRSGNLWAWNSASGAVDLISPSGARLARLQARGAEAVDVDAEQGLVGLFEVSRVLQWYSKAGELQGEIRLGGPVYDVCWIGPGLVALTPQMTAHRVEIWDLQKRQRVRTFGEEAEIHPTFGATRLRGVGLRYDFERKLLFTLESYTGDLQVFDSEGKVAWRSAVENSRSPETEVWLQKIDKIAKEQRDIQTPLLSFMNLAISASGKAWTVQGIDRASKTVKLVELSPTGTAVQALTPEPCPSYDFFIWGNWLILFTDVASSPEKCVSVRRLP